MTTQARPESYDAILGDLRKHLTQENLAPLTPEEAVDIHLTDKASELRESSLRTHRSSLRFFIKWCSEEGIDNINDLTGRNLHKYRTWRREDAPTKVNSLSKASEKTQQDILRSFIRTCEKVDAATVGLHAKVQSPTLTSGEGARDAILNGDRATQIVSYLEKYEYASVEHVVWVCLTETGVRVGALHSLDVDDYHPDASLPHFTLRHRPDEGTRLKNGDGSERKVALSESACRVLDDYLDQQRLDVRDNHGRDPLLATRNGRLSGSTIRKYVYKWTRPCWTGEQCPHGRDPEKCVATANGAESKCPTSRSAHAVRRGYITHELKSGVNPSYVSGRCDVSEEVIREHYDGRTEDEKMQVRHQALLEARLSTSEYGGE